MRTVVEKSSENLIIIDVFSRLIQERIIFIDDVIEPDLANGIIAQLLYLDSVSNDTINIYINSPGGQIVQGLAIYDVVKLIKSPIRTVCVGMAASMACMLMLMGSTRVGLKHSRLMLHEVSAGSAGSLSDMKIDLEEAERLQNYLYDIIGEKTFISDVKEAFKRDKWYSSEEALVAGILTEIL
jgi:ATP-dependent Clp protease protease subunit